MEFALGEVALINDAIREFMLAYAVFPLVLHFTIVVTAAPL